MAVARTRKSKDDPARALAIEAARTAKDDNAEDILVLDLREVSPVTDYFVIATGTSDRQLRAIADHITDAARASGQRPWHVAGLEVADWVVMDFVDVVIHLFTETTRRYYELELIWGSAPRVRWQRRVAGRTRTES